MNRHQRFLRAALSLLFFAALAGCGRHDKGASQVAARVNSDEITVSQVNFLLARTPNVTKENAAQAKRAILARLIEQQLAEQQAVKAKLDRSPPVVQALEFAKAQVLAEAYREKLASALAKPTDAEIKQYYADHPELFARRRIFNLDEINFEATDSLGAALGAEVAKARSMQDVAAWLNAQGIKYAERRAVRAAEQIPLEVLPRLQAMKDGEIRVLNSSGGRYDVMQVVATKELPIDEATAAPRIGAFIFNQRAREALVDDMTKLKRSAKIEYVGEFAAEAGTPTPIGAKGSAALKPEAPKEEGGVLGREPAPGQAPAPDMEKGVKGLLK